MFGLLLISVEGEFSSRMMLVEFCSLKYHLIFACGFAVTAQLSVRELFLDIGLLGAYGG